MKLRNLIPNWLGGGGAERAEDVVKIEVPTVPVGSTDILTDTRAHVPWVRAGAEFRQRQEESVSGVGRSTKVDGGADKLLDSVVAKLGEILASPPKMNVAQAFSGKTDSYTEPGFSPPESVLQAFRESGSAMMGRSSLYAAEVQSKPLFVLVSDGAFDSKPGVRIQIFSGAGEALASGRLSGEKGSNVVDVSWGEAAVTKGADPVARAAPPPAPKSLREQLDALPAGILLQGYGSWTALDLPLRPAHQTPRIAGYNGALPQLEALLGALKDRERPMLLVRGGSVGSHLGHTRVGILLPPGYDPGRAEPYRIKMALCHATDFDQLAGEVARSRSKELGSDGVVTVILGTGNITRVGEEQQKLLLKQTVDAELAAFGVGKQLNLDSTSPSVAELGSDGSKWVRQLEQPAMKDSFFEGLEARWKYIRDSKSSLGKALSALTEGAGERGRVALATLAAEIAKLPDQTQPGTPEAFEKSAADLAQRLDGLRDALTAKGKLPNEVRIDLALAAALMPGIKPALDRVMELRPQLLTKADSATGKKLGAALLDYLQVALPKGYVSEKVLGEYLNRVATRSPGDRHAQYNFADGITKLAVLDHPTMLFALGQAALEGRNYTVPGAYPKDGYRDIAPQIFQFPFHENNRAMPAYELALEQALVALLFPRGDQVHPDILGGQCGPLSVAISKLTGDPIRYGYAFNIKTGEDLVKVLKSQGGAAAFATVQLEAGGRRMQLEFPLFSDYDPETKTVAMSLRGQMTQRLSIEGMRFAEEGMGRPALFYKPNKTISPFLTPDEERRMGEQLPWLKQTHPEPLRDVPVKSGKPPEPAAARQSPAPRPDLLAKAETTLRSGAEPVRAYAPVIQEPAKPAVPVKPSFPEGFPAEAARALEQVVTLHPGTREAVELLAKKRPELFRGVDEVTGQAYAEQLAKFAADGLAKEQPLGFAEYIRRIAGREFYAHIGGLSHTHGIGKGIIMAHPGLILDLIRASKERRNYQTHGAYPNDGLRELSPSRDFDYPFASYRGECAGYERGFLDAAVYRLAPRDGNIHPDLIDGRSPLAAVGFQKLTGKPIRYGYAFNLRTGEDLAEVLKHQPYGVAMADVSFRARGGGGFTHFGYFSDYDPATKTAQLDTFGRTNVGRISLEDFSIEKVGMYYVPHESMDRVRTPELETKKYGTSYPWLKDRHPDPFV